MTPTVIILRREHLGSGYRWHGKVNGRPVSVDSTVVDFETRPDKNTEDIVKRAMVNAVKHELSQKGLTL